MTLRNSKSICNFLSMQPAFCLIVKGWLFIVQTDDLLSCATTLFVAVHKVSLENKQKDNTIQVLQIGYCLKFKADCSVKESLGLIF